MNTTTKILSTGLVMTLAGVANAQLSLQRVATLDFSNQITGSNIYSVAWDGTNAYVGSWSSGGGAAITAFDNALSGSGSFRTFGLDATIPANRGLNDLEIQNGRLVSTTDKGATLDASHVRIFNAADGSLIRTGAADARGAIGGAAFDPINGGVAFAAFGAGRFRQIEQNAGGATIWSEATGPVNFNAAWGTAWRNFSMDADGNVYGREGVQLIKYTRTGPNSFDGGQIINGIADGALGDNTVGQNVEVLRDYEYVLWNDRSNGAGGQMFENILKAVDLNGNVITIDYANAPTDFLNNALLDMSYDAATGTLAISEFSSNRVYIYNVVPASSTFGALAIGGLLASRRRR
jgi:hypothetical protein